MAERYKTGHRLPQQLAIDIITTNAILADEFEHTYVSSYDPDDYKNYKDPDTRLPVANNHTGKWTKKRCWHEFTTNKAIFTTLVAMDRDDEETSEFDQGAQYEVTIDDKGIIEVGSTDYPDDDE